MRTDQPTVPRIWIFMRGRSGMMARFSGGRLRSSRASFPKPPGMNISATIRAGFAEKRCSRGFYVPMFSGVVPLAAPLAAAWLQCRQREIPGRGLGLDRWHAGYAVFG